MPKLQRHPSEECPNSGTETERAHSLGLLLEEAHEVIKHRLRPHLFLAGALLAKFAQLLHLFWMVSILAFLLPASTGCCNAKRSSCDFMVTSAFTWQALASS